MSNNSGCSAIKVPNTCECLVDTPRGQYLLMASWPLGWNTDGSTNNAETVGVPVIFVLDANACFLAATDIARRQQFMCGKPAVVVGIGYPIKDSVYSVPRRCHDLTPPSKNGPPKSPANSNGSSWWGSLTYCGADEFQLVLENDLIPAVSQKLLPWLPLAQMPKVLFGHSFGGLFTLFSLFIKPELFDTYISVSPSIWFNGCSIAEEQEKSFASKELQKKPRLFLSFGTAEEDVRRKTNDTDESFEQRKKELEGKRMNSNAVEMAARLRASGKLSDVQVHGFELEEHGSALICGLQRGINQVLGEWWIEQA